MRKNTKGSLTHSFKKLEADTILTSKEAENMGRGLSE